MKTFQQPLSAEEEACCIQRMREEDGETAAQARALLIERNLRLVAHIAKKYQNLDEDMEDLISIGTIGLIKAVNTFDAAKKIRLSSYASKCIENAILSQMRLWFRINPLRAEKHQNGVFWHRFPRIFTYSAPLRRAM
ncbi:MAG: sigma-70 family RNA polymerase sigma factor [Lachnospiraceae bacterium]|nr:sigma-70 family RNA polymerase sigma factor [Lachnospiraceae bacterium]